MDEGEVLGGNKKARMITRFAQRSTKYSFVNYSPRTNGTEKKQLFLGAEFEFEGIGPSLLRISSLTVALTFHLADTAVKALCQKRGSFIKVLHQLSM